MAILSTAEDLLEIEWRELLIKKLQPILSKFRKEATAENTKKISEQAELRSTYPDEESAHEAWGYGYITEDEYRLIAGQLNSVEAPSAISAARDELTGIIRRLKSDIKSFKWDLLSDEEKESIRKSNDEFREQLQIKKSREVPNA